MNNAERYFAILLKRLRTEFGKKKAKEIVEELESHYRAKLIELREQGVVDAEAAALEALGPIDAIVEDYAQPAGWMSLKPIEKQAILLPTLAILMAIAMLAVLDLVWGRAVWRTAESDLFVGVMAFGLLLLRAGFVSGRIISRQAMLCSLVAVIVPAMVLSIFCYTNIDGQPASLGRLRRFQADEEQYLAKLRNVQNEVKRGKEAFANATANYVEVQYDPLHSILDLRRPRIQHTIFGCGPGLLVMELAEAERSNARYRQGPSIDPYRTSKGYKVVSSVKREECLILDVNTSYNGKADMPASRVTGVEYFDNFDLTSASHAWDDSLYFSAIDEDFKTHSSIIESLKPYLNQPFTDRWPSAALVFGDFTIGSYFWLMVLNLGGAISGVLWRAANRGYDKLIRS